MCLERQIVRPHQVTIFCSLVALGDVVIDLRHDGLLIGRELALGDVAQVGVGALQKLVGGCRAVDRVVVSDHWRNLALVGVCICAAFRQSGS